MTCSPQDDRRTWVCLGPVEALDPPESGRVDPGVSEPWGKAPRPVLIDDIDDFTVSTMQTGEKRFGVDETEFVGGDVSDVHRSHNTFATEEEALAFHKALVRDLDGEVVQTYPR